MAASGSTDFNLDLNNIVEEAFERCGMELRTGYELRTARRSLNLLTIEWANRGINLWTIEEVAVPLNEGVLEYGLEDDTIDIIDAVIRTGTSTGQSDLVATRISSSVYASIPSKNSRGRPLQFWVDRQTGLESPQGRKGLVVRLWPVPDQSSKYTLVYWRLRRMYNAGDGTTEQDIPFRLLPCLTAGLAYYLAMKIPEAMPHIPRLEAEYEKQWQMASEEDRDKMAMRIVPRMV